MFRDPDFHALRYLAQGRIESIGNLPQAVHRRVENSSLDPTDVCPIEAALPAETFLRVARPFAEFA
jgi:hypothetical protein